MAERTEWQQFRDDHPEIGDEQAFFLWYEVKGGGVAHEYWLRAKQKRIGKLATMPYAEYLKTPEWKQRRRRALTRAKHKCQLCGASGVELHVHHNTYENRGAEPACDLIVLCADCHAWFHGNGEGKATPQARHRYVESDYAEHIKPSTSGRRRYVEGDYAEHIKPSGRR